MSEVNRNILSVDNLRHTEYYDLQKVFDSLYDHSKQGKKFYNLVDLILKPENILLAFRNIKSNIGSKTPGTDKLMITDIGKLSANEVIKKVTFILTGSQHGYRPKPVRRKDIPKNGQPNKTRPLGIPCIWDRLIQQCIKQVLEPICEAKFSENSHGFRPNRSVEHAMATAYRHMQQSKLHFVVEVDIKGFFDNVNHSKLIKQMWAIGICDKQLIFILKRILNAPIRLTNGEIVQPKKGTPQGGIVSPLLANIVLNELDHWVESQWQEHPVAYKYSVKINKNGSIDKGNGYVAMRQTNLKEMRIVRYADDFRIFCRTRIQADKAMIAVKKWLKERLKLEVSEDKSKVVNTKKKYMDFLGFKVKVCWKGHKWVVHSQMSNKAFKSAKEKLKNQIKKVAHHDKGRTVLEETKRFNAMVLGIQNYYRIATNISTDCSRIDRETMKVAMSRLKPARKRNGRLSKNGRVLSKYEKNRYGKSKMIRYDRATHEPIYPIGYIRHKNPMSKRLVICSFTAEGRKEIHKNLQINTNLLIQLMKQPTYKRSIEYTDNRISKFSAQWGKCAISGIQFQNTAEIHCHHIKPQALGGSDKYKNLVLVLDIVHRLIHAIKEDTITQYLNALKLSKEQLLKLNKLREKVELPKITTSTI